MPKLTVTNVISGVALLVVLAGVIVNSAMSADVAVTGHNESEISHPKAEKEMDRRLNGHNKDRFAHPEMRQMIQEELKPIKDDTAAILVEIRKIKE